MKTLEWAKENIETLETGFIEPRFTKRFLDFLPVGEWEKYGFKLSDYVKAEDIVPKEWTEENVLKQLKEDVEFGIEKAEDHRGISAGLMFEVVKAWCIVLENDLEDTDYGWYGDKLFKAVDEHYGWGLTENAFGENFYKEW